jgi:hypothetical protein
MRIWRSHAQTKPAQTECAELRRASDRGLDGDPGRRDRYMSMLLCIVTPIAVYLAADSRQYPSGADTVQKVFLVGRDAIVGHSGIGVIGSWDAAKEVGRIAATAPNATFEEQLGFVQEQVLKSFNAALEGYSGDSGSLGNNPHLTIMLVKRDSTGRAYFARQEFNVVSTALGSNRWAHHAEAAPIQRLVNGETARTDAWWDVPPECPVATPLHFDSPEGGLIWISSISTIIRGVAGQSAYCSQLIGGPIRAAISEADGARWLPDK